MMIRMFSLVIKSDVRRCFGTIAFIESIMLNTCFEWLIQRI